MVDRITSIAELNRRNKKSVEDIEQYIKTGEYGKALIELKFILDNGSEFEASIRDIDDEELQHLEVRELLHKILDKEVKHG